MSEKKDVLRLLTLAVSAVAVAVTSGCASIKVPQQAADSAAAGRYELLFRTAEYVLKDYHFQMDRLDRRMGVIVTRPLTAQSLFEFWRKDASSFSDGLEGTLQTVYRTAVVSFPPRADGGWDVSVEVRLARPDRHAPDVTTVSQAMELYKLERGSRRYAKKLQQRMRNENAAVPLGSDVELAERIKRDINLELKKALKQVQSGV